MASVESFDSVIVRARKGTDQIAIEMYAKGSSAPILSRAFYLKHLRTAAGGHV